MTSTTGPQAPTAESEAGYAENLLATFTHWSVYLHQNQYYLGRVCIGCHRSGAIDLFSDLSNDEWEELRAIAQHTQSILKRVFNPDFFNQSSLGNETGRCHMHIVPRYREPRTVEGFSDIVFIDALYGKNWGRFGKDENPIKERPDVYRYLRERLCQEFAARTD